jgi:hypothetical protein
MFARQVCFRKVQTSTVDIDDSGDDENGVSVDDLLAQAAADPDDNGNASDEERGPRALSAGSALAPANINYRNTLLGIFYDTAQAARDRLNHASGLGNEPVDNRVDQAGSPLSSRNLPLSPPISTTSSQTTQSQSLGQRSSNEDPNRDDHSTSSAGINSNGKRPHTQLSVHNKENLEQPLPPVHVSNKKPRGGATMAGRGGPREK